ncbi:uncharacterized protein LOC124543160 [Vanessa cardui]|uniref:uncharacterized protein LOC124543160 n=1 Tax=Vanessa cardui TaxID=171605 RepID=UPI001F138EAC|nr:uncharacterized protein LOC124543160 [Vanessa cardui]
MEEIERLVAKISISYFEVESMHLVEVTHVINPLNFYVRPMKYRPIIQVMEYVEPKTNTTSFNVQDMVIFNVAYSCGGRRYLRGRITRISQIESFLACDIFAIDYGFTEKLIPIEYMWECPLHLANIPSLACDCQLANCYPLDLEGFSSDTIDAFKYYAGNEPVQIKVLGKKPNRILVELVNSAIESISTLLAMHGYITLGHFCDAVAWNPIVGGKSIYFNFKELSVGETLHVRVQSGDSLNGFNVVEVGDYNKYLEETGAITFYAKRDFYLSPVHFVAGRLVCIKNDNENIYERAFIKKVTKPYKRASVQLVDSGRIAEFHIGKMKYMPAQCLRSPVVSIYCKSDESQAWDNGLDRFLTPGFEFNITIKSLGYQFEYPNTVDISPLVLPVNDDNEARALPA